MRLASEANDTSDFLRVAVLAALNLADEVFRQRADKDPAPPPSPPGPARSNGSSTKSSRWIPAARRAEARPPYISTRPT